MIKHRFRARPAFGLLGITLAGLLTGCGDNDNNSSDSAVLDTQLRSLISSNGLTGDPATGRVLPDITDPKAQLGMKLFFSKALGGELDSACVSCHHPAMGGGDDLSLPIGVDALLPDHLGPGRSHRPDGDHYDGGPTVPRNAPTTFNIALWDRVLFHDGRVESLGATPGVNGDDGLGIRTPDSAFGVADPDAGDNLPTAQARFPVTSPEEMKDFLTFSGLTNQEVRSNLEQRIGDYGAPLGGFLVVNNWLEEFRTGFENPTGTAEELITFPNIVEAIGEYERSQTFVATPWRDYVAGDTAAISDAAKRGALLFYSDIADGGAGCADCHSGDFFTDEQFHVIAMPQIGRGKGNGVDGNDDFGRFRETGDPDDLYAFRTPTLLNVTETGPWGHAGAYTTLENTVRHHLDPETAVIEYDYGQIDPTLQAVDMLENTGKALDKLAQNRANGLFSLQNVDLTDEEVADLLAFLNTLTDPCIQDRSCIGQWIPDAGDTNPDTLRVNAVDNDGNFL